MCTHVCIHIHTHEHAHTTPHKHTLVLLYLIFLYGAKLISAILDFLLPSISKYKLNHQGLKDIQEVKRPGHSVAPSLLKSQSQLYP